MAHTHTVVNRGDHFACLACSFMGSLVEAIRHAVANQFRA